MYKVICLTIVTVHNRSNINDDHFRQMDKTCNPITNIKYLSRINCQKYLMYIIHTRAHARARTHAQNLYIRINPMNKYL